MEEFSGQTIIFVSSVRTDSQGQSTDGFLQTSYKNYETTLQSHPNALLIFDEYESQSSEIKEGIRKLTNKQIHLSATPNPYESLLKFERTTLKSSGNKSRNDADLKKSRIKFGAANAYENDLEILFAKRNGIENEVAKNLEVKDFGGGGDIGCQYFYRSDDKNLQMAISQARELYSGKPCVIAYIDDSGNKKVEYPGKEAGSIITESLSAYEAKTDLFQEHLTTHKFVSLYDIARKDHIGADFGILSKETTNKSRVIDCNIADLDLSDLVQLYGRIRSVSSNREETLRSTTLPLYCISDPGITEQQFLTQNSKNEIKLIGEQIKKIEGKIETNGSHLSQLIKQFLDPTDGEFKPTLAYKAATDLLKGPSYAGARDSKLAVISKIVKSYPKEQLQAIKYGFTVERVLPSEKFKVIIGQTVISENLNGRLANNDEQILKKFLEDNFSKFLMDQVLSKSPNLANINEAIALNTGNPESTAKGNFYELQKKKIRIT